MDTKSFIFGVACGALVFASASWLLDGNSKNEVTEGPIQEAIPSIIPDVAPPELTVPKDSGGLEAVNQDRADPPTADSGDAGPVSTWPANLGETLEAEPKDDSWAYYMEQAMLQYLSSHSAIAQFDISSIECRTTQWQIEVIGYDESTVPVWHQVMYDMRQQPWSEFSQYGSSSGMIDGRLMIVGTLYRVQDND